jgi:putative nucleotidyltransferase with HDIG domain
LFYRLRQIRQTYYPKLTAWEIAWVKTVLPPAAFALFWRQEQKEQRHAFDVASAIERSYPELSYEDQHTLLTAALLHDCGKSLRPVLLWQRIFAVLAAFLPAGVRTALSRSKTPFSYPLRLAAEHPLWGAELAREAGLPDDCRRLIAEHHQPTTYLGRILQTEDDKH